METLNFTFIETWVGQLVGLLQTSATTILGSVLVLMALIVGAFFLLGLGKKAVKKAK